MVCSVASVKRVLLSAEEGILQPAGEGLWPLARASYSGRSEPLPSPVPTTLAGALSLLARRTLPISHPTAVAFLDESGAIASDRFFTVGCLKLAEPSILLRQIEKWRDRHHWYREIHVVDLTLKTLPLYKEVVDIVAAADCEFSCFVADRQVADPVARFGTPWKAYERLAAQLLHGSIRPKEIVTVLADNYSTPDGVVFEQDLRAAVNGRLHRLAIASVVRLDSKAATPLQIVDLLTSTVTFEFRQQAGLAGKRSPKAKLARHVRTRYGVKTCIGGVRVTKMNVACYTGGQGATIVIAPPAETDQ